MQVLQLGPKIPIGRSKIQVWVLQLSPKIPVGKSKYE